MAIPQGINWHNTINTSAVPLGNGLSLMLNVAGNIGWLGAASTNAGTITVGFGAGVTVPTNGVASATDGWPLAAGQTLPFLTGEGEPVGSAIYAKASALDQDLFIIGYAPNQGAAASSGTTTGNLVLEDGVTFVVLEDGVTLVALEP